VRSCSARRGLATSLGLQAYPVRGVVSLIEGSMRPCSLATLRLSRSVSCSSTPRTSGVGTPWRSNSAGECRLPGERKAAAVPCSVGWRSKPPSDVNELRANPRRSSSTLGWTRPGTTRLYPRDSGPDKGSPASRLARRCAPRTTRSCAGRWRLRMLVVCRLRQAAIFRRACASTASNGTSEQTRTAAVLREKSARPEGAGSRHWELSFAP
jgi:hypothetical protein